MSNPVRNLARSARQFLLLTARRMMHARVVNHAGVKIAIGDYLSPVVAEHILNGDYERSELKGIRALLDPEDIVLELGAGIGFISLQCARVVGCDRVFAFEANPALEAHIRRNYDLNGLHPKLEMCILGEHEGQADFFIDDDLWESSMIRRKASVKQVTVPVRSLNEMVRRIRPTFLIMDIEGGEYEIIKQIDLDTIRKVAIEVHIPIIGGEKVEYVKRRLIDAGFVVDHRFTNDQQFVAVRP